MRRDARGPSLRSSCDAAKAARRATLADMDRGGIAFTVTVSSRDFRYSGAMRSARWWLVGATVLLLSTPVFANGRLPASNQIAIDAKRPDHVMLRTTFGILYSQDHGKTWDWVCETALHYGGIQDPMFTFTDDGNLVGATFDGVVHTRDQNVCNFEVAGGVLKDKAFVDLTTRKADPAKVLVLSGGYVATDDAGVFLYDSALYLSQDNGGSFAAVGKPLDPTGVYQTVDLAPSNPQRIYVSGSRGIGADRKGLLLTSDDGGATFHETQVPLTWPDEYAPYIAGVHPTNPDILYVRTAGPPGAPARLLLSTDAGATFTEILKFQGPMEGFALNSDGSEVWAGGTVDRLHHARTSDHVFKKISDVQVQCLTWAAPELWLCSNEITGFIAGRSTDNGQTFSPLLKFKTIRGPIKCPAGSVGAACLAQWPALQLNLGIDPTVAADAGTKPSVDAGTNGNTGELRGGACSMGPAGAGVMTLSALSGLALTLLVRRRNRPSPRAR